MKKALIITGFCIGLLFGANNQKDIYLEYTNKIINYEFNLKHLNDIKSPFYEEVRVDTGTKTSNKSVSAKKRVMITLISIFEKKAYIRIDEYLGEQLISVYKKWIGINDKIYDCKLVKLTDTDAVFKCKDKTLYKTINKKIPTLRDSK